MNWEQEQKLKDMAAQQTQANPSTMSNAGSLGGYAIQEQCKPTLMERVRDQKNRAQREARNTEALIELEYLLDKNPEIARILHLLDFVKL